MLNRSACQQIILEKIHKGVNKTPRLVTYCNELTLAQRMVLDVMIGYAQRYAKIYCSHFTIARLSGISRNYCQVVLKQFERDGIIRASYRHMTTSVYELSTEFFVYDIRGMLSRLFKSLLYIPSYFLFQPEMTEVYSHHLGIDKSSNHGQISNKYNKYIYINVSSLPVCARARELRGVKNQKRRELSYWKKGEKVMVVPVHEREAILAAIQPERPETVPSRPVYKKFPLLKITPWGKIKLSMFDDRTIEHALRALSERRNVQDPFKWVFKVCLEFCRQQHISPDLAWYNEVTMRCGLDENAPFMEPVQSTYRHNIWTPPPVRHETIEEKQQVIEKFKTDTDNSKASAWLQSIGLSIERLVL